VKSHKNPSSGSRVVPREKTDIRTDKHDEVNNRFSHKNEKKGKLHCAEKGKCLVAPITKILSLAVLHLTVCTGCRVKKWI